MINNPFDDIANNVYPHAQVQNIVRLTGGVSASVHQLDLKLSDGKTTSLVIRAHGPSHSGHPAELEFKLLQALHHNNLPVPMPLLVDVSGNLLPDAYLVIEYIEGTSTIPGDKEGQYINEMANLLSKIHRTPTTDLPALPIRIDPIPEVLNYLPEGSQWDTLRKHLRSLTNTAYLESPTLLHGDFWPENLLWQNDTIAAVLDWEDAAFGDPLSDVACCQLELRYKLGKQRAQQFTQAYAMQHLVDNERLALWQVYVAAAAQRFMGEWGLSKSVEAHMRKEALASIQEAGVMLTSLATSR